MHRPTVSFPRALKQYTAPRVLIEEFEDAVPLELFLTNGAGPFDHRIANLGLDAFLVSCLPAVKRICLLTKATQLPEHALDRQLCAFGSSRTETASGLLPSCACADISLFTQPGVRYA